MRGLGRVKVLQKPLDLVKKVLPRSRRQRRQDQTRAVAAAEPGGADAGSTASTLGYRARTPDAEAAPAGTTTTTTVTPSAPSKSSFTMLSSMLPSRSAAAKPADGVKAADPPEGCPICQDPVGLPNPEGVVEAWTSLRCGHRFGTACIQTWLQETLDRDQNSSPSCPVCRATAKHPACGHPVCPPSVHGQVWAQYQMRLQIAQSQERERIASGRPLRRRLQRRSGHPRIPTPPRREAEKVGRCTICMAHEAQLKVAAQPSSPPAAGHRETRPVAAAAPTATQRIKSYLPVQVRVHSTSGSDSGPARSPAQDQGARGNHVQSVVCDSPAAEPAYASQRRESV